jgi:hypothetical protein
LNCDSCLKETRFRRGYHIVQTVDWSSLSWNLERNQYWEASGPAAETSGRMQAGTETSRYRMGSGQNEHFIRMDDAGLSSVRTGWHVVRTDETEDRWASGRDDSIVWTAYRELEFLLTCRLWNSGIPVYSIFTLKWFCPNTEWGQNTNTYDFNNSQVSKGFIYQILCRELLDNIFLKRFNINLSKNNVTKKY